MKKTKNNLGKKNSTPSATVYAHAAAQDKQLELEIQAWNEGCRSYYEPFFGLLGRNPYPKNTYRWSAFESGFKAAKERDAIPE